MNGATILVVDNDKAFVREIEEFLKMEGYSVVTATDCTEARRELEHGAIALAIIDMRLADDTDDNDFTGLDLAKQTPPDVPKIILTRYPTYEAVREALGPSVDALPPAVGFVAKQEGLESLLRSVRLALLPGTSVLGSRLLQYFQSPATLQLPDRIRQVGSEEASRRLERSFESTREELTKFRDKEIARASHHHFAGLISAALGMLLILLTIGLLLRGPIETSALSFIAGVVINAVSVLFFVREDAAHKRVRTYVEQLDYLSRVGNLIQICESLSLASDRDVYRKRIVDHILDKGLVYSSPLGS